MPELSPSSVRTAALAALAEPGAPRVLSPTTLQQWLAPRGIHWQLPNATEALGEWGIAGLVERVRRGIYLNLRAQPRPTAEEAAPHLRRGAVISLQKVLGDAGVLNNPTPWVTAVMPLESSRAVGLIQTERYTFQFVGMRADLMMDPQGPLGDDAYQPYAAVPTATPEKALLDWLYLAKASPLWRLPPRQDIEFDDLDADRLARLASAMGLESALHAFQQGTLTVGPAPVSTLRRRRHP